MVPEKLLILLAEDDQDDRLLFKNVFDKIKINHSLHFCEDGLELMDYLQSTDELPHIIFLDLHMPGKSGLQCLKEIRQDEKLKEITIAIYSTSSQTVNVEETFIAGANVYIKKPNDFETLEKILSEVIALNWQYVTDGLNRDNFMMNFDR